MVFKKKSKPRVWKIVKEESELGGSVWTLAAKDFDELFNDVDCFQFNKKVWAILEIGHDSIKVYRGE